jgi:hypothetical protein
MLLSVGVPMPSEPFPSEGGGVAHFAEIAAPVIRWRKPMSRARSKRLKNRLLRARLGLREAIEAARQLFF